MNSELLATAKALPLAERIEFVEALWDSIAEEGHDLPLTPEEEAEIDRRLEEHRRNPESAVPWKQVKAELEEKYRRPK
jgi:putative addiction module component (TIGR02574 family)